MSGLATFGLVIYAIGWLLTVVLAFKHEGPVWAAATLFIPIAWIYYLITRWRKVWPSIILVVIGATLFVLGDGFHSL